MSFSITYLLLGETIILEKRWICQKCGYVQNENYDLYHRCAHCGSIDIELKIIEDNMMIENNRIVISH